MSIRLRATFTLSALLATAAVRAQEPETQPPAIPLTTLSAVLSTVPLPCASASTSGLRTVTTRRNSIWARMSRAGRHLRIGAIPVVGGLLPTPNVAGQGGDIDSAQAALAWQQQARPAPFVPAAQSRTRVSLTRGGDCPGP